MLEIKDGKSKIFLGMHNGLKCIFLSNLLIRQFLSWDILHHDYISVKIMQDLGKMFY